MYNTFGMNTGGAYCNEANMTSAYNNAFNVNMSSLPRVSYDPFAYGKCDTLSSYRFNPNPVVVHCGLVCKDDRDRSYLHFLAAEFARLI